MWAFLNKLDKYVTYLALQSSQSVNSNNLTRPYHFEVPQTTDYISYTYYTVKDGGRQDKSGVMNE